VGNDAMASLGGHLKTAVVSATCEIVLHQFQREVRRKPDAKTGLSLMDIG
jgi:predicted DNA-binding protein with PD1-like motif